MVHALSALDLPMKHTWPDSTGIFLACQSASLGKCAQPSGKRRGRRGNKNRSDILSGSSKQTFIAGEDSHNLKVESWTFFSLSERDMKGFGDLLKYK
ncbi:hypothetical protein CEXT_448291 [Caerostris extrusa]|uniref:Uncharacterized protein n=1 Tax=Caerostris extrusa TaxID=172846 RepID=A0AAV4U070_CAEEX|nr:hypothetical protein CEXT_448291 [Caerostris extrusa]